MQQSRGGTRGHTIDAVLLVAGLSVFVAYYCLSIFRFGWDGDFHLYIATVHALYRDPWLIDNGMMPVTGRYFLYSPHIVAVGLLGKLAGVTPYRALQFGAVLNVVLYAAAIAVFFRTFSPRPANPWPPLVFLVVSLFLRAQHHGWSSETNYLTLRLTQAYPSFLAWSLALFTFVVAEHALRGRYRRAALIGLVALIAFQFLNHALTASWVIGLVGLRALYELVIVLPGVRKDPRAWSAPGVRGPIVAACKVLAALAAGLLLTGLWPYYSPLLLFGFTGVPENKQYGVEAFAMMPAAYLLGLMGAVACIRAGYHRYWAAAFVATVGAWLVYRQAGIHFGERYIYFMAFFPQFFIAQAAGRGLDKLLPTRRSAVRVTRTEGILAACYIALIVIFVVRAPIMKYQHRSTLASPTELLRAQPTEQAFYARWQPLSTAVRPGDVIMMPVVHDAFDIAAVTGAKAVAVPFAFGVPDFSRRQASIALFFTKGTPMAERSAELARWGANKIVLVGAALALRAEIQAQFGPPLWEDAERSVYAVR